MVMRKCMRISVLLLFLAVLLQIASVKAAMPLPIVAMKTLVDGYFYVPNATAIDPTGNTHMYYLKVDLWCNLSSTDCEGGLCGCLRLQGDQIGNGTNNPYGYNSTYYPTFWGGGVWPSGSGQLNSIIYIARRAGLAEGNTSGAVWSYMADVVADRKIDGNDTGNASVSFGHTGTYSNNTANIHVVFGTGQDIPVDSSGYAPILAGESNFTVYNGANPILSLVTFYNTTSPPPPNLIYGVTLNSPQTDPSLNASQTFVMSCTPSTDDSLYGININFEYNYTGNPNFVSIPTSGGMLVANATSPINVRNNTMYSLLINATTGNDYYVRCRLYNSTTNITTNAQRVSVRYPPNLVIAEFRLYQNGNGWVPGSGTQLCDITSSFGNNIPNSNCSNTSFYESGGWYRGEIELCNDQLFGRDVGIKGVVQGNLSSTYIDWNPGIGVVCYNSAIDDFVSCDNTTIPNALYIDASLAPPIPGTKLANTRTGGSCQWYLYSFMAVPIRNNTWFNSNLTTVNASIGSNPQVGRLSILLYTIANMKIAEFRLYQSSNMTTLGSGTQVCDVSSSFGNNIPDNSICTGLTSYTQYRAEMRVCYDQAITGKNLNITGLVHGNLNSSYIWNTTSYTWGGCATGNGALSQIGCSWNTIVPNGMYINTTTAPPFTTGSRTNSSCQWFVYNFTTGPLVGSMIVNSNLSTQGVSSGINPQVNNLNISVMPQSFIYGVTLNPPAADFNVTDLSNFTMACTANTSGGYNINITFEYNSTTQGWGAIPASGANFTINGNNPEVNVTNGLPFYTHTVNVSLNSFGTYWIRCRISNSSTSLYSNVVKVMVSPALLNITLWNPSPLICNSTNSCIVGQYNTLIVNASVNCSSNGSIGGCGSVSCSVRYNSSSNSSDTLVSETQGATPFYVISSNMTHDFTGVSNPSTTNQGLYEACSLNQQQYAPPTSIFTGPASNELSTADYALISSEDGLESTPWRIGLRNAARCLQFSFQINESISSISNIRVYYKGNSSANTTDCSTTSYLTRLYIWNFTSSPPAWSLIGNTTSNFDDVIASTFNSSFGSIVNSSYMYLLASSDLSGQTCNIGSLSTDYAKVEVQLTNKNVLPCGNLSANQICRFSWLLNATGVNTLRTIDVNCSSNKSTVSAKNTNESYVYLQGIEIHTDKSSYRNCGQVFYKVSSYDLSNNPISQNVTLSIYDPNMNLANQSNVQTSGGVYAGLYMLPPSAIVGQWLIKASSCGVYNNTFGVGIGNSSNNWKVDILMPTRVKYGVNEPISFTVNVYNQLGEKRSSMFYLYIDNAWQGSWQPGNIVIGPIPSTGWSPGTTHSITVYLFSQSPIINETRYFYVGS